MKTRTEGNIDDLSGQIGNLGGPGRFFRIFWYLRPPGIGEKCRSLLDPSFSRKHIFYFNISLLTSSRPLTIYVSRSSSKLGGSPNLVEFDAYFCEILARHNGLLMSLHGVSNLWWLLRVAFPGDGALLPKKIAGKISAAWGQSRARKKSWIRSLGSDRSLSFPSPPFCLQPGFHEID